MLRAAVAHLTVRAKYLSRKVAMTPGQQSEMHTNVAVTVASSLRFLDFRCCDVNRYPRSLSKDVT
jgi:hypothetical protein